MTIDFSCIGLAIANAFLPMQTINECLFKLEDMDDNEENYDEVCK